MAYNQNTNNYATFGNYRPVPLAIRLKILFGSVISQIGWFFFGFGMIFVLVFVGNTDFSDFYLGKGSPQAEGKVISVEATSSSVNKRRVYACNYEFKAKDGKIYQATSYTTGSLPNAGNLVNVEYLANKPSYSRISGMAQAAFPPFVLFVLIFPLVGLIMIVSYIPFSLQSIDLLKNGIISNGKLIFSEPTNTQINKRTVYKLTFEFEAQDGQTYQVIAKSHTPENLTDEAQETLFYNANYPQKAVLKDNLPGSPKLTSQGTFEDSGIASALPYLIAPGLTIVGYSLYFYFIGI